MITVLIILFLLLSALFSGSEIAYISADKLMIELKKKKGSGRGNIIAGFYKNPSAFLGTMLVGNNIALVVFTALCTNILEPFFIDYFNINNEVILLFINTIIITVVVIVFGEFLPKTLFKLYANNVLLFFAYPLRFLELLLAIPSKVMTGLSHFILKYIFKSPIEEDEEVFTRTDLNKFIKRSQSQPEEEIDKELFEKALYFKDVKVDECMVPRPEIISIEINASIDELIELIQKEKKSRIIVYEDDIDNILGYIHHQQLLTKPKTIKSICNKIEFVPEVMRVHELMNEFIRSRKNIACVVDEFGGTSGIITLEDILEEIFGEIEDEHDTEVFVEEKISGNEFRFSGRLEIDYLNDKYGLNIPEGEYNTLSGYIVTTTETIPEKDDIIELDNFKFILESVSKTKIETIRLVINNKGNEEE